MLRSRLSYLLHIRNNRYGWVASPYPTGSFTLQEAPSCAWRTNATFLDDKLLPSTSHAVERGNRRYRKMQKHVYRVRAQAQIGARVALDMWREAQGEGRHHTLQTLHEARAG